MESTMSLTANITQMTNQSIENASIKTYSSELTRRCGVSVMTVWLIVETNVVQAVAVQAGTWLIVKMVVVAMSGKVK